jgi:uncharacterized protein (DUF302 family)
MALEQTAYGIKTMVDLPFEEALDRTKAALKENGFGVLTDIDVQKTMKEKLGKDFRKYEILGACNPPLAHRALTAELDLGLMLPCNVIVYEEGERTVIAAIDPQAAMGIVQNETLTEVAKEARAKIVAALEKVDSEAPKAAFDPY